MNKVKIKTSIDLSNPTHLRAMNVFFDVLGGHASQQAVEAPLAVVEEETVVVPKPKRKSPAKKKETPAVIVTQEAPAAEKVETPAVEKVETTETKWEKKGKEDKLVDLRAALNLKARAQLAPGLSTADLKKETELRDHNREAIKGKLGDVGAKNISTLEEAHYLEVIEFIKTCKSLKPLN